MLPRVDIFIQIWLFMQCINQDFEKQGLQNS